MPDDKEPTEGQIKIIPEAEWTQPMHKQAEGRLKRPGSIHLEGSNVEVNFIAPKILSELAEKAVDEEPPTIKPIVIGIDHAAGSDMAVSAILRNQKLTAPMVVLDEAHMPVSKEAFNPHVAAGSMSGSINMTFEDYEPAGAFFNRWLEESRNIVERDGTDILVVVVPWTDNSPEAHYLNSNPAFANGAKLPRGKCTRKYGNKKITRTMFTNCTVEAVQSKLQDDLEERMEEFTLEIMSGGNYAHTTVVSK